MRHRLFSCLLICRLFAVGEFAHATANDRTGACKLQLEYDWIPIDCLILGNQKQRELAAELCQRKAANLESLSSFPRDWKKRTRGTSCNSHLRAREDQLLYAERLRAPKDVWGRVGQE